MAQRFNSSFVTGTGSPRQDAEMSRQRASTVDSPSASPSTPTASFKLLSQAGNHDGVANIKGELEEHFDMGDWEFVGPQGAYAESVFKAKTWGSQEEVAIKVVSLKNELLQDCK